MAYAPKTSELRAMGLMSIPGLGAGYPELKRISSDIINKRVSELPWVPPDFQSKYSYFTVAEPDAIITLYPASGLLGTRNPESLAATWLDTPEKVAAWTQIAGELNKARELYAQNKINEGRQKLAELNANAVFWTKIGNFLDGVGSFLTASGEGAKAGIKSAFFWLTIAAVGAGVFYWYYKDPEGFKRFFRSFGKK